MLDIRYDRDYSAPVRCEGEDAFNETTLSVLKRLIASGPFGNRWFKVNLHVHGQGNDPAEIARRAREAEIDIIAVTDHQAFSNCDAVIAAAQSPGRTLTVFPGMELTSLEGVHVLALFPPDYSPERRTKLLGWLEISGGGDTRIASRKNLADIFEKIEQDGGITVVPHPFSPDIGLLDGARKISTKVDWLESGHVRLIQLADETKVKYVERDGEGNWVNRYVLATATPPMIASSTYCFGPFNRSDAHRTEEIPDGCSWFRMSEPSIEGLKQVGCEPRTRISRKAPTPQANSAILGMRVSGGYCDGQEFHFNEALNCLVGQNYAGKSAGFDFIRFALGLEQEVSEDMRDRLLLRLHGILGPGGKVEVFLRHEGTRYAITRVFNAQTSGEGPNLEVLDLLDQPLCYRHDPDQDTLVPVQNFRFPVEVYEQGRINRLRDDVGRQLEMIDEFAHVGELKIQREGILSQLSQNAELLAPLYTERDQLNAEVANLDAYKQELDQKAKLLPGEEEQRWAKADAVIRDAEAVIDNLRTATSEVRSAEDAQAADYPNDFDKIFGQAAPSFTKDDVEHSELLTKLVSHVETALAKIEGAREIIVKAVGSLAQETKAVLAEWHNERKKHDEATRTQLRKAGVESPQEIIDRVKLLRREIKAVETTKQPRLATVAKSIDRYENAREGLLNKLEDLDRVITKKRQEKAGELTGTLGGQIKIVVKPNADISQYLAVLNHLCDEISSAQSKIAKRDDQLARIVSRISPVNLARSLIAKGAVRQGDGSEITLCELCGVTGNTQVVLCRIAENIQLLSELQTVSVPDVPEILVLRRGETVYADLRTGLSQGEQSAAILTLALQTRAMPLILDQPEDELGYNYVVHLVVPKILQAKFSRQLLIVTHNANIPVLGDADYVIKMENRPRPEGGRTCVVATEGSFECDAVTQALIELEGGERAFQFRRHRYAIPAGGH